jgi:hypothetical protein
VYFAQVGFGILKGIAIKIEVLAFREASIIVAYLISNVLVYKNHKKYIQCLHAYTVRVLVLELLSKAYPSFHT